MPIVTASAGTIRTNPIMQPPAPPPGGKITLNVRKMPRLRSIIQNQSVLSPRTGVAQKIEMTACTIFFVTVVDGREKYTEAGAARE
jgi:hypothetical protein